MRKEVRLIAALALLLVLALVVTSPYARQEAEDSLPSLSSHSAAARGGLALYLWLADLGYDVRNLEYRSYAPGNAALLFVLNPTQPFDEQQVTTLEEWVRRGGTLVLAAEPYVPGTADGLPGAGPAELLRRFGLTVRLGDGYTEVAEPRQPALSRPPVRRVLAQTFGEVRAENPAAAVYLGAEGRPLLLRLPLGAGTVYLLGATYPLSNEGLAKEDNWRLALNLVADVPSGGRILFDEYHHGFVGGRSWTELLLSEHWGWAILYACLVGLLWLALSGRRFGRAVPLAEGSHRSIGEYVQSLAGLLRRSGARSWLLAHTHEQLKRELGHAYGVSAALADDDFAAGVGWRSGRDATALREGLVALRPARAPGEGEVLALVRRASAIKRDLLRREDGR